MTNPIKLSLTRKNESASFSFFKALSTTVVNRVSRASQSSSTSLSERKLPVVLRTCVSIMKKPTISCVTENKLERDNVSGMMRSDCAYAYDVSEQLVISRKQRIGLTLRSAWYDFRISSRASRAPYIWIHWYKGVKSTCSLSLSSTLSKI